MSAKTYKDIQVQLVEAINCAFDECARAQKDLQWKVQKSIVEFLKQHREGLSPPDTPAISKSERDMILSAGTLPIDVVVPLPVAPQLAVHSLQSWESADGERDYLAEFTPDCNDSRCSPAAVGFVSSPALSTELPSGTRVQIIASTEVSHENDGDLNASESVENCERVEGAVGSIATRQSARSVGHGTNFCSEGKDLMYVSTTGQLVRSNTFVELPDWVRIAELLLNWNSSLACKLGNFWSQHMNDDRGDCRVSSMVELAAQNRSFALTCEKAYRRVHTSLEWDDRRSKRTSLVVMTAKARKWRRAAHRCRNRVFSLPIHPSGGRRLLWDSLAIVICLQDVILLPMSAFDFDANTQALKGMLELAVAVFWTLDIVLSFCTAYFDEFTIQRNFCRIASSYVRSWFFIDFAIVLNDWLAVLASKGSFGVFRFAKLLKTLVRVVRLLRLWKISTSYGLVLQRLNSETALTLMKIGTQALCVATVCHYIACGWYALHGMNLPERTWVHEYIPSDASTAYKYFTSFHWALTQLTPASIKVQPVNMLERVYNIIIILVAMVVFSSFISSITVSMNHLRACRLASIERDGQLRRFLAQHDISKEISHVIWSFMKKSANNSRCTMKPSDVIALKSLPEHILEQLYKDAFEKQLRLHPLMNFYSIIEPKCMTKICRTGVEQRVMLSLELLWHDLTVDRMLFVQCGALVYEHTILKQSHIVGPGEWCCEEVLWSERPRIEAPFTAGALGCELLMLDPEAFRNVAKQFPQTAQSIVLLAQYGEEFTRYFNQSCGDHDCSNLLFNEKEAFVALLKDVVSFFQSPSRGLADRPSEIC